MKSRFFLPLILLFTLILTGCSKSNTENLTAEPGRALYASAGNIKLSLPENTYTVEEISKDQNQVETQYFTPINPTAPDVLILSMNPSLWQKGILAFFDVTDECFTDGFISSYRSSALPADRQAKWSRSSTLTISGRPTLKMEGTFISKKTNELMRHEHYVWKEKGKIFITMFIYHPTQTVTPKEQIKKILNSITHS